MPTAEQLKSLIAQLPVLDEGPKDTKKEQRNRKDGEKGKLTGPTWADAARLYDQILDGGQQSITDLIALCPDHDTTEDHKPRYALQGIAAYVCRPGKEKQRADVTAALVAAIGGTAGKNTRAFLIRALQLCGDASATPALAPLLKDPELCDAAAQAMLSLGGNPAELLRQAFPQADGKARLAIVQAMGVLKDPAAVEGLIAAAGADDETVRLTALWSLAKIGTPRAASLMVKASTGGEGWYRIQTGKLALQLADALAASGNKNEAALIYQHLRDTRKDPKEAYLAELAQAALNEMK